MDTLSFILNTLTFLAVMFLIFFRSYFSKKGENLATKEDIAKITQKIEEVKDNFKKEFLQHQSMTEIESELLIKFYNLEHFLDQLMDKYKISRGRENDLSQKINKQDNDKLDKYRNDINILLAKLFITIPDDKWAMFREAIPLVGDKLKNFRLRCINAMRKTRFPETTLNAHDDLRCFLK